MVRIIKRDGHHTPILRAIQFGAGQRLVMFVTEHPIPAHPGRHHRILRGTAGESLTRMHKNAAGPPGHGAELGGDKPMTMMQSDGTLRQVWM